METNHKEGAMLQTETNTLKVESAIRHAAGEVLASVRRPLPHLRTDFEHGQWWITNTKTGEQWSIVDSNGPFGFDFEKVTDAAAL